MKLFVAAIMFVVVSVVFGEDIVWEIAAPQDQMLWGSSQNDVSGIKGAAKSDPHEQTKADRAQNRPEPVSVSSDPQPLANINDVGGSQSQEDAYKKQEINVQKKANKIQRQANVIQGIIAGLTLVLVFIGFVIGWRQMQIMAKQTDQMEAATRYAGDAAIAAKKSADTALLQAKIMERKERPWVVVNPLENYKNEHTPHASYAFKWAAENVGSSPAFLTELTGDVKVVPFPIQDELPEYPQKGPFAPFFISPNRTHGSEQRDEMSPSDFKEFREGKKALAFYGIVKYYGAFSGPHCTCFYSYWVWEGGTLHYVPVGPPNTVKYE